MALKGGKVLKVFIDNPFPIEVLETGSGKNVTGLSTSSTRSKLAVVDEDQRLVVYEIQNRTNKAMGSESSKENNKPNSNNKPAALEKASTEAAADHDGGGGGGGALGRRGRPRGSVPNRVNRDAFVSEGEGGLGDDAPRTLRSRLGVRRSESVRRDSARLSAFVPAVAATASAATSTPRRAPESPIESSDGSLTRIRVASSPRDSSRELPSSFTPRASRSAS